MRAASTIQFHSQSTTVLAGPVDGKWVFSLPGYSTAIATHDVPLVSVDHLHSELARSNEGDQGVTVERAGRMHDLEFEIP